MISSTGNIGFSADSGGLGIVDSSRPVRLFKVTGGSNPYTATAVYLDETGGTRDATGEAGPTAAMSILWEVNGYTEVPANKVVIAFPNTYGQGYFFSYPFWASQVPVDMCVVKSGGNVTDIRVTWQEDDGDTTCETIPECSGAGCDDLWWCTETGVTSAAGGTEPTGWISGPYQTQAEAIAACATSGASGGTLSCCSSLTLPAVLYASLSGGHGTVALYWDGTRWQGSKALSCGGKTIYIRYLTTCGVNYSCDGSSWGSATGGATLTCTPTWSHGVWSADMNNTGSPNCVNDGTCGTITFTITE